MPTSWRVFGRLVRAKGRMALSGLRSLNRGRQLLFGIFGLLGLGFVWGLYGLSSLAIRFMLDQGSVGETIIFYALNTVVSSLFFLVITSSAVTALTTLFRSADRDWLLARPLPRLGVFYAKCVDVLVYSAWIVMMLASPVFLALFAALEANAVSMVLGLLALLLLVGLATWLGILLAFGLMRFFMIKSGWLKLGLSALLVGGMGLWLFGRQAGTSLLPDLNSFVAIRQYLSGLETASPLLPGGWLTNGVLALLAGRWGDVSYWFGLLTINLLMVGELVHLVAQRFYLSLIWQVADNTGGGGKRRVRHMRDWPWMRRSLLLAEKDIKLFVRDSAQWTQTILIVGLFGIFLLILRQVPARFRVAEVLYATPLAFMAFVSLGYMTTVLALRFIYPLISLEGKAFWMVLTSPISRARFLWHKFFPMLVVFFGLGGALTWLMGELLSQPAEIRRLTVAASLGAVLVIASLTFVAGIIGVDLRERDPSKLASSMGSIITTMLLFLYLAAVVMVLSVPFDAYFRSTLADGVYDAQLSRWIEWSLIAVAGLIGGGLWWLGRWRFGREDF